MENNFKLTKEQEEICNKKLEKKHILQKPGAGNKVYVEGSYVRSKLNEVFGIGKWSYNYSLKEIIGDTIKKDKVLLGYYAKVVLTVQDLEGNTLTINEVGTNDINYKIGESLYIPTMPQIDQSRKGAVTDGLKRCAVNFGNAFGLNIVQDAKDYGIINK